MPKALHKKKWRNVLSIEKCEGGFTYQLEGVDGKVYHDNVDDIDLSKEEQHEIINPDGSITRGPGKEPLRKPLKKSMLERWKLLKAKVSHELAFGSATEDEQDEQDDQQQDRTQTSDDVSSGDNVPDDADTAQAASSQEVGESNSTSQPIEDPDTDDNSDAVDISSLKRGKEGEGKEDEENMGDDVNAQEAEGDRGQNDESYDEEKLIDLLRQDGYSDSEIAYIVHAHVPGGGDHDARAMDLDQIREQEKHDHHMGRIKDQTEIQTDHAKRMADLEYEHAKKEKELRIKHLEEELKIKLEQLKNKGKTDGKTN